MKVSLAVKSTYKKKIFLQGFYKQKKIKHRQTLTMTKTMASSGLWENVILTKIKTYHR